MVIVWGQLPCPMFFSLRFKCRHRHSRHTKNSEVQDCLNISFEIMGNLIQYVEQIMNMMNKLIFHYCFFRAYAICHNHKRVNRKNLLAMSYVELCLEITVASAIEVGMKVSIKLCVFMPCDVCHMNLQIGVKRFHLSCFYISPVYVLKSFTNLSAKNGPILISLEISGEICTQKKCS